MNQTNVGVILSGAGYLDGAEIQEATLTLYFLDRMGVNVECFSVDQDQHHVVDHKISEPVEGTRNVLAESARIARGRVADIETADIDQLDALILPGGFGVAKNLSDFAVNGDQLNVHSAVSRLVRACYQQQKPLGFICIAPVLAAALIPGVSVTIGNDADTAAAIQSLGATHINKSVREVVIDQSNRVISTPAYMYGDASISDVATGIEQLVSGVLEQP